MGWLRVRSHASIRFPTVQIGNVAWRLASPRIAECHRTRKGSTERGSSALRRFARFGAEVALAVVLLAGAGLLLRSLVALTQVAPGFTTENAMSFRIVLYGRGYDLDTVRTRVTEFETALRLVPGVTAVAATSVLPLSGAGSRLAFSVESAPPPGDGNPDIGVASVTPHYVKTIGATW
jgi:putative ABC transport system permease protein